MPITNPEAILADLPSAEYRLPWVGQVLFFGLLGSAGLIMLWVGVQEMARGLGMILVGALIAVVAWWLAISSFLQEGYRRLQVLEHGLLDRHRGHSELYRWDEIEAFVSYDASYGIALLALSLWRQDGKRLDLAGPPKLSRFTLGQTGPPQRIGLLELALTIEQASCPHRLAAAQTRFDAGERLVFGALGLSQVGLSVNDTELPWERIADFQCDETVLAILEVGQASAWRKVVLRADCPNIDLLPTLLVRSQGSRFSAYQAES